ncbi:hypothetical protein M378DRAFT_170053, partial [Amanita muscaria Koide BX008]
TLTYSKTQLQRESLGPAHVFVSADSSWPSFVIQMCYHPSVAASPVNFGYLRMFRFFPQLDPSLSDDCANDETMNPSKGPRI